MANKVQQSLSSDMRSYSNQQEIKTLNGLTMSDPNVVGTNRVPTRIGNNTGSEVAVSAFGSDSQSDTSIKLMTFSNNALYNGTNWDRMRNNESGVLLGSGSRNITVTTANQANLNAKGIVLYLNVSTVPATETLDLYLRIIDPSSGSNGNAIASITGINAIGIYKLLIYPGNKEITTGFNRSYSFALPRTWCAQLAPSSTGNWSYSLAYHYIL